MYVEQLFRISVYLDFTSDLLAKRRVKRNTNRLGPGITRHRLKLIEDAHGNTGNVISAHIIWYNS